MAAAYSRFIFGPITWYSFLITLGILLAFLLGQREERRLGMPTDTMIDLTLIAVPGGVIGARLYYVLMELPHFLKNPLSILYIWEGGVAIYGAVIGGAACAYWYCRRKKISFLKAADMIAPGLLLAQAIGRWGNYFNMEAFGAIIENPQLQFFPVGVQIYENGGYVWHQATFFYESLWNFCGFAALMTLRKRQRQSGNLILWYLMIYGSGRFIIEQLRTDSLWIGSIRVSQGLSLLLCTVAAAILLWRAAKDCKRIFLLSLCAMLLAIARWFVLDSPAYLIFLLTPLVFAACVFALGRQKLSRDLDRAKNRKGTNPNFFALWILLPLALDLLGLILSQGQWISHGLSLHLHTLLCSLTLPCYLLWFQQKLTAVSISAKRGASCPSES